MNYRKFSQNKAGDTINYSYVEHWYLKILSCIKGYALDTFPIFISTPCISNCWYLKVHNLESEKDILKYKLSEMNFVFEISRDDCRRQKYSFSVYSVDNPLTNTRRFSYGRTALNS